MRQGETVQKAIRENEEMEARVVMKNKERLDMMKTDGSRKRS